MSIMVTKKTITCANKESYNKESAMAEMCAAMDDLSLQNQDLEDNILYIQQFQDGVYPTDEVEMLDS